MFDIIDVFIREIVSHHESIRGCIKEIFKVLDEVLEKQATDDLILRTDNETQFRSRKFQTRIRDLDIYHEKTIVIALEENAHIESLHNTLKRVEVYQKHYHKINHCRNSIAKFLDKYNNRRSHSSFGKIPSAVYYKKF